MITISHLPLKYQLHQGGVYSNNVLWLKADAGVSTSGSDVTQWNDASVNVMNGVAFNNPTLTTANHNFNPTITFNGTNSYLDVADGFANFTAGATGFVTARPTANNNWSRFFDFGNGSPSDNINFRRVLTSSDLGYETANGATNTGMSSPNSITNNVVNTYSFSHLGTTAYLYKNGLSLNSGTVQALQNITRTSNFIARSNWGGDAYYAGDMSEIILYNRDLTTTEHQKINTYLAIKYGTTLDQGTPQNYLASNSSVIWDATTNATYKNNIAGIIRDDASGLTQKQSQSVNAGLQVVIGNGNTIAASNSVNASTFSVDRSALIWGDNGGSSTSWTATGAPSSRLVVARTWKVQETGTVGSVKVQVADKSGTNGLPAEATTVYMLVDADGNFSTGATEVAMTLNGTNWEANVDLANGQYFTFATQIPAAPGGVYIDNSLWLRADAGTNTTTQGANVTTWSDQSVNGNNATTTSNTGTNWVDPGSNPPVYRVGFNTQSINFNPTIDFSSSKSLDGLGGLATHQVFTVYKNVTGTTAVLGLDDPSGNGGGGQGTLWHDASYITLGVRNTSNGNNIQVHRSFTFGSPSVPAIIDVQHISAASGSFWINGDGTAATITPSGTAPSPFSTPSKYRLGKASDNTSASSPVLAEVISYSRNLSATERQQVNSYLGLKYGVTLGHNYLNGSGATIWDLTTNSGYNNNITGIGRDDASNLMQRQSKSNNTAALVTIGHNGTIAGSNAGNEQDFLTNNLFFVFGDNNGSIASWTTTGAPTDRQILTRKWKVQETGTVGNVKIQVPDNGSSLTTKLPTEQNIVYLLADADGDFSSGAIVTAMTLNGTNWEANYDFSDGQYFTFATPTPLNATYTQTNVICNGASTGAIDLSVTGGVTPYTYDWGSSVTTQDRTGIPAGSYTVTVTDALGATTTSTIVITELAVLNASVAHTDVSCHNGTNGTITVSSPTGGSGTYQYRLDAGAWQASGSFTSLAAASYSVQIRDAANPTCTLVLGAELVEEPVELYATADAFNVTCNGGTNGSINLTTTGGTAPYSFNWGSSITSEDRSALAAGSYTVTVTDGNLCTTTATATVTQPALLSLASVTTQATCYSDGDIDLSISGGTAPYTYDWADITGTDNVQDRSALTPGTYNVTVTDASGCTATASLVINTPVCNPSAITICQSTTNDVFSVDPDPMVDSYTWTVPAGAVIVSGQGTPSIIVNWNGASAGIGQVCVKTVNVCSESVNVCFDVNIRAVPAAASLITPACTNADLELLASGGTSYTWSGPNGFTSTNQAPVLYNPTAALDGTYTVTVTDTEGCSAITSVAVSVKTAPTIATAITLAGCLTATGAVDLTVASGLAPYTYQWSNGAVTQDISSLLAGAYSVTVTDANGCTVDTVAAVSNSIAPTVTPTVTNLACTNTLTGAVTLLVSGSASPFSYNWSTGATTQNVAGLANGIYNVTVTDNVGCKTVVSNEITEPNVLQIDKIHTNINCFGATTGSIDITVTGGTGSYTYDWSDIAGTSDSEDRTNLAAGTYIVTVTDGNGCTAVTSITISQPAAALSAATAVTNLTCNGVAAGVVNLTVSGGTTAYTYLWSSGETTEDISSKLAGSYTVTVTDANGCTTSTSATITEPTILSLSNVKTDVSCNGGTDGTINLTVSGGTTAYTYLWSSGETTEDISSKSIGSYTVTVTDANGCSATSSATITEPTVLGSSHTVTNVTCNNGANGSINLTITGGTAAYTYLWSSGETTEDISSKAAGTYYVTVTDAEGCSIVTSATITEPTVVSMTGVVTDVTCNGGSNGAINITATGGTGALTYNWGSGITTEDRTALPVGIYTVTVTDASSCSTSQSFTIAEPSALALSTAKVDVTCNGAANGSINLTVSGGVTPYTYLWSNTATTEDLNSLNIGSFTVTVTDANGCTATISETITEPTVLATTPSVSDVNCYGASTGSVSTVTTGGTLPYTYAWSNGETTANISSLTAGSYILSVTDANGCMTTTANTVTEPAAALAISGSYVDVSCFGGTDASITTSTTGGTTAYTYLWSNGATTANLNTLTAGTYTVTVTDNKLCTATSTFVISEPAAALSISSTKIDVNCFGNTNGSIDLTISGGTTPYTFNWSNGAVTQNISSLAAGTYDVTVTDAKNCTSTASITITQPAVLSVTSTITDVVCLGGSNGAVNLTVAGGVAPYTYLWSNGATTEDISSLVAGNYNITVTDNNGCITYLNNEVNDGTKPIAAITTTENSCAPNDDKILNGGSADLTASGGVSYLWSTTETTAGITVNPSSTTTYSVTVTALNGCKDTTTHTVQVVSGPTAVITATENSCAPNDNKILSGSSLSLVASGGVSYSWDNGLGTDATQDLNPIATTTYSVTITDAYGCTDVASQTITIITAPVVSITANENSCTTDDDKILNGASAVLTASGASTYVWSTAETTAGITVNPALTTTYTVTATDANGCVEISNKTISVVTAPTASITTTETSCTPNDDKILSGEAVTLTAAGGISYAWSTGATTAAITENPVATTTYIVTVTDANGCTDITSKTITIVSAPTAAIVANENSCTTDDNKVLSGAAATLTASGGLTYAWSTTETTAAITVNPTATTTYTVTVTDGNGCTDMAVQTVEVILDAYISIDITENSCTINDDKIFSGASTTFTAVGGVTYTWNTTETTAAITHNPAVTTTYSVTATDFNGCIGNASKTVTVVSAPIAAITEADTSCTINDDIILKGESATLTVSGGVSYEWSTGEFSTEISVFPTATTTYTVTVTDANGCTDIATKIITVVDTPTVVITAVENSCTPNDDKVLSSGSVTLTATGGVSYTWDNSLPAGAVQTVTPSVNTTYSVTATDAFGCTDTTSKTITIVPQPTAAISGTLSIVRGDNTTLTASGGNTYLWTTTETTAPITVTPAVTTIYTVTVTDANGCTDTETVTVLVDDYTIATRDDLTITEDAGIVSINVIANDVFGNDGPSVSDIIITQMPTNGIATVDDNGTPNNPTDDKINYTANLSFNGNDTIIYRICDLDGDCDTALVVITINAINDAPVAVDDVNTTNEDVAVSNTVSTNDSDTEGDALTFTAITTIPLSQGTLVLNADGTYTYTPALNFNGVVTLDYQVCDATLCDTATLTITVNAINDAPVAVDDANTTNEDTPVSNTVATNDSDVENDALTFTAITTIPLSQGTLVLNGDGTYTYTPALNFNGVVTLDYQVCDATLCDTATLTITVNAINDAPVAVDDANTTNEDTPVSNTVATNDSDVENDALTFTAITTIPVSQGALVLNGDGTYTYTPALNFNGVVTLDYQVCDATLCDTATLTITVNAINDAPVAVNDAVSTNEDTPVSNTVATNDSDTEGDALTFTAITTIPLSQGTLVLNGDGTYTYTPALNFNGVVTLDYQVCDATLCDTATLTITVNAINDAPVAVDDANTTNEDTPVSNTVATNDSDVENDALTFTAITTIPVSQGTLVLNGDGTYTYTPALNFNGVVTLDYQVCDATLCDTATLTITVNAINDAPVAVDDANTTNEDTPVSNTVATNDSDVENDALTFTAITTIPLSQGTLVLNGDGTYTYTPALNFNGTVTLDYQVCDATLCDTATLTITVNAINDAPVAVDDANTTNEDTPVSNTVATNDSDVENDALTFTAITTIPLSQGTLVLNGDGTYTYTPALNFNGVVTLDYQVCDATLCDTATLTITVNAINDAPVAVDDANTTNEDTPVSNTVATNDSDVENDALTFTAITTIPVSQGALVLNGDGTYTYTPALNFNGVVTLDYQVCDATLCDTATLTITVNAINDAPVAVNDAVSTNEDTPVSNTVATNDSDTEGDALTFTAITTIPVSQGTLVLNGDGTYTYTPALNFNGVVTLDYQVCDATLCDTATLTITVNAINDAPVAVDDANTTNEDTPVSNTVATNDSDVENDALTFTAITTIPLSQGTLVLNADGTYTYTPALNFNGVVTLDYQVCDATLCDTATLTITVNAINDAPVAVDDANTTNEDTPVSNIVATNDSDVENDALTFTAITTIPVSQGTLVLNADGTYTYTPALNFNGVVTLDYQVCDATLCDTATLTITVNAINDAPVAVDDANTTNEDTPVSNTVATNDSDVENDALTFTAITTIPLSQGTLVLNGDGTYTYTPALNFNGVVTLDYQVCDATLCDTATLTITVNAINDAPVAVDDANTTNEDTSVSNTVATNDSDVENDALTFTAITTIPLSQGTLVLNGDGTYTYTPALNFNGVVTLDYQVCDATLCDTATLTITVNAINDAPVAVDDANTTNEDTPVSNTVATNDSDVENDALTFTAITTIPVSQGTLVLNADGTYTYTPALNFNGVVTLDYQVCDATLCDTATLTITVNAINDAPVAVDDVNTTNEDTPVSNTVATNDSDVENDALTFTAITTIPLSQGTLVLNGDGTYTYTPALNFNGVVTLDYQVCDATLCDTATLTITVNAINDAPVAVDDANTTNEDTPVSNTVATNDSDVENDALTFTAITTIPVSQGTLVLNGDGTYTYTPALNFNGVVTLDYQVCDATLCDTATLTITVNAINDAPVAVDDANTTNEDTPVSNTVATNDSDVENDALTFTAITTIPLSQGTLVLNGDGTYTYTPALNFNGVVTLDYQVCDATLCDTATLTITVNAINDAPVAVDDANTTNEDTPVSNTVATNDSDVENDALTFTAITTIPVSQGTLVLNADGTYTYTPALNFNGVVTLDYQVCDATLCDTATLTITVNAINDAPVAVDDVNTTNEDTPVSNTVATNDSDVENDALTFTAITTIPVSQGTLVLNGDGTYTYTPALNFNGVVTLDYQVCDATLCDTATLTITVNAINDAPVAVDDVNTTNEDTPVSNTVATNDSDVENDALTFTAITTIPLSQGTLVLNGDGTYTYTPALNFNGVVTLDYQVCDATLCDTATLTITVNAINDAPVAVDDANTTNEDTPVSNTVATNDSDVENDALTFTAITTIPVSQGTLVLNGDGTYTYTPALNFNGVVTLDYQVCDATLCDTATLTITVNAINDAPVAVDDANTTNEDTPVSNTVATNDSDTEGDALTFTAITTIPVSQGALVLNGDGTYTYTPALNFNGVVTLDYQVCDATLCDTATLTITVNAINDAPVAVNDAVSTNEDTPVSNTVATNDSDTEGDALTFTAITTIPVSQGTLVLNGDGTYTYTPALNFNGVVTLDYQVCDATLCDTATLTITVNAINDAPVAVDDANTTNEDTPVSNTVATNDSDVENDALTFTAITTIPLSQGTLVLNADGTYTYTPALNFNGVVTLDYQVCDATLCDTATLTITVNAINDAPVAVDDANTTNEDTPVSNTVATNDSDVENDALTFTAITTIPVSQGTLVLNADGTYTYTPALNFNGVVTLDYQVCDATLCDTATLTITVNAINDAPVAVDDANTTNEDTPVSNTVATNDSDVENDALTFTAITTIPLSQGTLVLNGDGTYTYTPALNFNGVVTLDYQVCDATLCDTATLTITVNAINDAPVAVDDANTTNEDTPVSNTVATNDSDVENDALTFTAITTIPVSQGTLVLNADGTYTYTPALNFNGVVTLDYQVCDATLCDTATLTITVNAINDAPVAVDDANTTNEDTPVSNTVATNDSDVENDALTFTAITTIPLSQGTLVLNADGTYTYTPALNFNGVVTLDYQVCDATLCDTATLTITVNAINDAPVAVDDANTTNEDTPVSNTVATNDSDVENDALTFTAITTIPLSQGTLVLNGDGTYTYTPALNFNGVVTLDYQVCDATLCDTATLTITVNAINDAPVAVDDVNTTNEDTPVSNTVATNDSDVENDALTFTAITTIPVSQGTLVLNADGTYTYTPALNFNGVVTLDYQVCDATLCDTATLTITVNAINDAPVAVDDVNTTNEDTPVSNTVATNDSDVENDALTFTAITTIPLSQGTLVLNADGTYTYTPALNFNGVVTLDYQVCDATLCDTATLTITVNAINDAPVAVDDANTTNEDTSVSNTVATNDSDVENDALTFTAITTIPLSQGTLVLNGDGTYTYTPALNFNGVVTLDYQVCDATLCDTATLTITVNAINDAPVAVDDANTTNEDTPVSNTVATNDSDVENDALTFTAITTIPVSQGTLVLNADGTYTYTPALNFNGVVTLDYQVCDATLCDTATLTITVNAINDAPVAVDDVNTTNEDTPVSNTVATNDSDVENDALTFTAITTIPLSQGTLVLNGDGTYTYTPALNFNGVVTLDYQVCDATLCDTATLTITVNAINDAPVAVDDANTTNEDTPVSNTVATNDSDVENDALTFTAITTIPVSQGTLVLNGDGTYTYTPALNFNGVVTLDYQVCDATLCDTATLTITVNAINDAPVAVDDANTTNEDTPVSNTVATNDSDTEGDALTFTAITTIPVSQGTLVLNADGTYTYTPALNFNGVVTLDYQVCDATLCDTATLTITVNAINDAPVAVDDATSTNEDTPVSGSVATNDSDIEGGTLTYTAITPVPATEGVLVLNPDGTYTFTPAPNFNGNVVISYTVCDTSGACDTAILTITVNAINDAPVAVDDATSTNEDTPVSGSVATNDSDIEGGTLTYTAITPVPATEGVLVLNPDGTYTFTPSAPNFNGNVVISYTVCDTSGACDTAILTITVNAINDAPVAVDDATSTNEDTPVSGSVATNDSDIEGGTLTYTAITPVPATEGVLVLNPDGTYTFTPAPNFNGNVVISYTVCDTSGACDTATLTITVNAINDAPVAVDDATSTNEDTPVSGSVATNDSDIEGGTLTYTAITPVPATEGVLVLNPDGTYTFTPAPNFNGNVVISYTVCDTSGACDTATLTITVNAINDAPVAVDDATSTNEDTPVSGSVATNDSDTEGGTLTYTAITPVPATEGVLVLNPDGTYTFTPAPNFNGNVVISYTVCDTSGACDTAILTITVNAINDAPVAVDDATSTNEDTPVSGSVATNDSDIEGGTLTYTAITPVPATEGILVLNPDGTYTFTPAPNFNGNVVISYTVCDTSGACDTATLTITVNPVNDAPVAVDDATSTVEDNEISGTVATNDSDAEGDVLTFTPITNVPSTDGVLVLNTDGTYTFTPAPNFNGIVTVDYQVCDSTSCDTATLTITVISVNNPPVAVDDAVSLDENTEISDTVATNDSDAEGDVLTFTPITNVPSSEGVLVLNTDGTYTFTPEFDFNGVVIVDYEVCDSTSCDTATLVITVNVVNTPPDAGDDAASTIENTVVSGNVGDNDFDDDYLTFTPVTNLPITEGEFTLEPDGSYTFTPATDYNGTVTIVYAVCDTANQCDTATLVIKVKPVNDRPIAQDTTVTTPSDKPVSGTLIPNITDNDNTTGFTFDHVGTVPPNGGTIVINGDGTFTFTPDSGYVGEVRVNYVVCDPLGLCDTASIIIIVTPANRPPIAKDDFSKTYKNYPVTGIALSNDSDPDGDTLVINTTPIINPTNGTVDILPDGTYIYRPNNGFVGKDTFVYQVCDTGVPSKCDTAKVVVVVGDEPHTTTIEKTLPELAVDTICLNTDILVGKKYTVTNYCPSTGQYIDVKVIPGTACVKVIAVSKGQDRACLVTCDEFGFCDTTYVIVTVTKKIDIDAINDDTTTKTGIPVITDVIKNDSLHGDSVKTIVVVFPPNHGQAVIDSANNIVYTPETDFCGVDSLYYQVCTATSCDIAILKIKVQCDGLKFYTGFSPNGDGINDYFVIDGIENFPNNSMEIYNRWGNNVFKSKHYKNDWAGTWGTEKLPDGTYFYIFDDGEGNTFSGYIQIHQ